MDAIPIVMIDMGEVSIRRGILIDCPAEFFSLSQIQFYHLAQIGWSRCPLGYSTYTALDAIGRRLVIPAIILPDQTSPNRKFPGHGLRFDRKQIEVFMEPFLRMSEEIKSQRDREFKNLTHDLRAISTEIYHTSLSVKELLEQQGHYGLADAAGSVLAAQQMMSVRLDIIDYETGLSAGRPKERVPVFKKFEKVYKCFRNKMNHRRIVHRMEGSSFSYTYGPPILEIAPFVIMENAIKYAPQNSSIIVRIEETISDVIIRFDSIGPKIKQSELERIFEQNFRGEAVTTADRSGSGIGLYAAKSIIERHFNGKIHANQFEQTAIIDGTSYFETRFTIILPIQEDYQIKRFLNVRSGQ